MRPRFALFIALTSAAALAQLVACGASETPKSDIQFEDPKDGGKKTDSNVDPPIDEDSSTQPDASSGEGRIYAHTKDTLYLYEPVSNTLTEVGKFTCTESTPCNDTVIDLAVDRTGEMYGTTFDWFFKIDPITAKYTRIELAGQLDYPNALSFVPAGTVDPTKEALVGYASDFSNNLAVTYVQIDTTTGAMTTKGNMNATTTGPQYRSSGDLFSLIQDGNKTYATVKLITDGGVGTDLLAEIDPSNGNVKKIIGDTKQNNLWGFGYWAGKGYGFSDNGTIVQIDMSNGSAVVVKTLTGDAGPLPWYGAGVTTQAPLQ
jgi:large repetitive protein